MDIPTAIFDQLTPFWPGSFWIAIVYLYLRREGKKRKRQGRNKDSFCHLKWADTGKLSILGISPAISGIQPGRSRCPAHHSPITKCIMCPKYTPTNYSLRACTTRNRCVMKLEYKNRPVTVKENWGMASGEWVELRNEYERPWLESATRKRDGNRTESTRLKRTKEAQLPLGIRSWGCRFQCLQVCLQPARKRARRSQ